MRQLVVLTLAAAWGAAVAAQPDPLDRPAEPVVLSGEQTDALRSVAPEDLVAFRVEDGAWVQIPVQVDERFVVDYATVYGGVSDYGRNFSALAYADEGTFTGADPDDRLDADDEIVFMAADAGAPRNGAAAPAGTDPDTATEIELATPGGDKAFVYLFARTGALDPAAGADYVRYRFRLLSGGSYRQSYDIRNGPNPEDTDVETDAYARHFSDRWVSDELRIADGPDLLDRLHIFYGDGRGGSPNCARTEDTFSGAEGAFVTNKDGPVRAIRTYVGANSGPLTERTHLFYAHREDIITTLRVHSIPGIHDVVDYAAGVDGLRYTNNLLAGFLDIDGTPDAAMPTGQPIWEAVTSSSGSVAYALSVETNLPQFESGFYRKDDAGASACTGDERPIGMSGVYAAPLLCTDPTLSVDECRQGYFLVGTRIAQFAEPSLGRDALRQLAETAAQPLAVRVSGSDGGGTVSVGPDPDAGIRLSPPTPNPFVAGTRVRVELAAPGRLTARLYDALGREVREVYAGTATGAVELAVDGGEALAPGVYVLHVVAGADVATVRLVRAEG